MNGSVYRSIILIALFLLIMEVSLGSTPVVASLASLEREQADQEHGVLLGTHHVIMNTNRNGQGHAPKFTHSKEMEWHIEEVTEGKRFFTIHVPTHGPFVVRLPVGSYRVTMMRLPSPEGTWHGGLPTTFEIRPGECTSLGTSMLQMQLGFVTGWVSRHVLHEQEISRANHDHLLSGNSCSISMAPLGPSVKQPVRLDRSLAQQ